MWQALGETLLTIESLTQFYLSYCWFSFLSSNYLLSLGIESLVPKDCFVRVWGREKKGCSSGGAGVMVGVCVH